MSSADTRRIQHDLWLIRGYYFTWMGGLGLIWPFMNLFYIRQGLSGAQVGWVLGIFAVLNLVATPIWTRMIQRSTQPQRFMQISMALNALGYVALGFQYTFLGIILLGGYRTLVAAGIAPVSDALAVAISGGTKSGYGSVRLWGSLGWAILTLLTGVLIERYGFLAGFIGCAITQVISLILLHHIHPRHFSVPKPAQPETGSSAGSSTIILKNPALIGVALMLLITGLMNSGVLQFETVYLADLGARAGLLGIASMVSAAIEIPAMLWTDKIIFRRGARWVMLTALALTGATRLLVLLFPSITAIFFERAIGGIAFSFYTVSLVKLICQHTPEGQIRPVLAIFTVALANFTNIISTPIAGSLYDLFGGRWLFLFAVAGYALGWMAIKFFRPKQTKAGLTISPAAPAAETAP